MFNKKTLSAVSIMIASLCGLSTPAAAQEFPTRAVRLIVGFAPGGSNDIIARLLAPELGKELGQQVVVENRPGAGGNIAADVVLKSPPDGYAVFMCTTGTLSIQPFLDQPMPFDTADIAPITQIANAPYLLLVNPELPVKSVKELVQYAKAHPGALNYASSGNGTTAHLAGEMLHKVAGVDIVHVPYKGAGQAMVDLTSGRVSLMFDQVVSAMPHVASGKLRALAIVNNHRLAALPDLPTTAEEGLANFDPIPWTGLCTGRNTPPAAIQTLQRAMTNVLERPEIRKRLIADGVEPIGSTAQEFAAFLVKDKEKWGSVIKSAGITGN